MSRIKAKSTKTCVMTHKKVKSTDSALIHAPANCEKKSRKSDKGQELARNASTRTPGEEIFDKSAFTLEEISKKLEEISKK